MLVSLLDPVRPLTATHLAAAGATPLLCEPIEREPLLFIALFLARPKLFSGSLVLQFSLSRSGFSCFLCPLFLARSLLRSSLECPLCLLIFFDALSRQCILVALPLDPLHIFRPLAW